MEKGTNKQPFKNTVKQYTVWFCVFAFFAVIIFFLINHKSMYSIVDGVYQQLAYFVYTGKWIRLLLTNIFIDHRFEIPMWDMSIGPGGDPLIVFSSVANPLCDPTYFISALIPQRYAEYAFDAIIILKMYLSGLAFTYYAHCKKQPQASTVAGALVYTFSAVMYTGFTQVSFINVFYLFPLLMAGVDKLWSKKDFKLYTVILALCFINSYYFTYMMALLVIACCIIRFILDKEAHSIKAFAGLFIRFFSFSLLGIGIGTGFQLPAIINLTGLDRLGIKWDVVVFSLTTLKNFLSNAFSMTYIGHEGPWGVSAVALPALILLFADRKQHLIEKLIFTIYTLALFFPVAGSLFNGFNYPTGRYIFGYIFVVAYIVTLKFEDLFKMSKRTRYVLAGISLLYLILTALLTDFYGLMSAVSLLIISAALIVINGSVKDQRRKELLSILSILLTCILIGISYFHVYIMSTEIELGFTYEHMFQSNGLDQLSEDEMAELNHTRYDLVPFVIDDVPLNSSMLQNVYGYDYYNTNYNNGVDRYYIDMAINSNPIGFMMNGLRGRNYLELMNGTSLISIENRNDKVLRPPYSYELLKNDGDFSIYRASEGASLVYFYDEAVPSSALDNLNPIEAEELMMNYCVTGNGTSQPSTEPQHSTVDYEITETSGITMNDDGFFHTETGGYMILSFDEISDSEISLFIEGITSPQYYVISTGLGYNGDFFVSDTIEGQSNIDNMYYHWRNAFVVNFGFTEEHADSVRILFLEGNYKIDNIKIYSRSREQLDATTDAFYGHAGLSDVSYKIDGNHIHVNAATEDDRYLYFAVPYSEGWSAYVDGEPVAIERANIGFMTIPLSSGDHDIELDYSTPYLLPGLMITAASILIFAGIITVDKKRSQSMSV